MADKRIIDLTAETALTRVDTFLETDHATRGSEKASVENLLNRDQNNQTGTAYTLVLTDSQKRLTMNNGSANSVTVPPNSSVAFPINSVLPVFQLGVGRTSFVAGAGVTINSLLGSLKIAGRYGHSVLVKTAADVWSLFNVGDAVAENLTGTAPININGTVGATTPAAVAATTISATGGITSTAALNTFGGTAFNSQNVTGIQDISLSAGTTSPTAVTIGNPVSSLCPQLTMTRQGGSTSGNDFIKLNTSAGEVASIDASGGAFFAGEVGIGTASSSYLLDINDDGATGTGIRVTGGGGGGPLATFTRDVGPTSTVLIGAAAGDPQIRFTSATDNWSIGLDSTVFNICDGSEVGANQRLVIDTSGNVGIGTATPTNSKLTIKDSLSVNPKALWVDNNYGATTDLVESNIVLGGRGRAFGRIGGQQRLSGSYASGQLNFYTYSSDTAHATPDMVIRENGNVGIGTTSPGVPLHIARSGESSLDLEDTGGQRYRLFARNSDDVFGIYDVTNPNTWLRYTGNSTVGSTKLALLEGGGNVGIGELSPDVLLHVGTGSIYQNKTGSGDFPGISDTTSHGFMAESQGALGSSIHVSRTDSAAGNFSRQGTGDVLVFRNTSGSVTEAGSVEITGATSVAYRTSSDYRLKENVVDVADGIDRVKQLNPVRFNFIGEDRVVDGFLAHEVQDIVPEAIGGTKDAMKDEEYVVSPAVYEDVVHPAVEAVYDDVVHTDTNEEVVHPAVEATYDEDGNELTPAVEEYTEQVLLTEEYTEQVLVAEAQEEWTESVLVAEAVTGTRSVPAYQGIDQSKLVPLLTAALQEAISKIESLEARMQTLEG
jgi:hypothetical protein